MAEIVEMELNALVELAAVSLAERLVVTPHLEVTQVEAVVVAVYWVELVGVVPRRMGFVQEEEVLQEHVLAQLEG